MPMKFEFPTDIDRKLFDQLAFALVLTYTKAGQAGQKAVKEALPQRFTIRNTFVVNGIRLDAATKRNPVATIFARTDGPFSLDFMILQETGGIKQPTSGRHLALPSDNVKRNKKDIVTRANRPKALLNKGKTLSVKRRIFKIDESTPKRYAHGLPPGIYQRNDGRGKGQKKLKFLFQFQRSANIKQRFQFRKTAIDAAKNALPQAFEDALVQAVRTAR